MPDKIQIVLDADVIIHFSQGGYLHLLPQVIPDCSPVLCLQGRENDQGRDCCVCRKS